MRIPESNLDSISVVQEHRISYNHDYNWDDIEVLDGEPAFHKTYFRNDLYKKTDS